MRSFSILIPTLDEEAWIVHAVRAARASLAAAGVDGEVIVSDGGSGDATVARARRYADRVVHADRGRAHQLNAAASVGRGDILVMVHADALLTPPCIESMSRAIDRGAGGGWFQIDILAEVQTTAASRGLGWMAWGINLRTRWFHTATGDQCVFCTREAFAKLGGLPDVALMEANLFARALRGYGKVEILPAELRISGRRWEQNGLLRTMFLMYGIRAAHRAGVSEDVLARVWEWASS